jgi:hypothetical protein
MIKKKKTSKQRGFGGGQSSSKVHEKSLTLDTSNMNFELQDETD